MAVLRSLFLVPMLLYFFSSIWPIQIMASQLTITSYSQDSCYLNLSHWEDYTDIINKLNGDSGKQTRNDTKTESKMNHINSVLITGNSTHECVAMIEIPAGHAIQISVLPIDMIYAAENAYLTEIDYIYVDTITPSDQRYVSLPYNATEPCGYVFHTDKLILHFRTQHLIKIDPISSAGRNSSTSVMGTNHSPECQIQDVSSDIYVCETKLMRFYRYNLVKNMATCQLPCPERCTCILFDAAIASYYQNNTVAHRTYTIIYPPRQNWELLDYSNSSIVDLNSEAFRKFYFVIIFHFREGLLTILRNDTFKFMPHLVEIDLSSNYISTIDVRAFQNLPMLQALLLQDNNIHKLHEASFHGLYHLRVLSLNENKLTSLPGYLFRDQRMLLLINLSRNKLQYFHSNLFSNQTFLSLLFLNYNSLPQLPPGAFRGLHNLKEIHIHNNSLTSIDSTMFQGLHSLYLLTLDANKLSEIYPKIWLQMPNLKNLNLSHNLINDLQGHQLGVLTNLDSLDLRFNKLTRVERKSFQEFQNTTDIYVDDISVCCYTAESNCIPRLAGHPFFSCHRLLPYKILKVLMWLLGFSALICNMFVILHQCREKRKSKIQQIQQWIIMNLAASDLLMGIYMIIITSADVHYSTFFPLNSQTWRNSSACKIASILAIISSEASIFFVTLISIERALVVLFPFQQYQIGRTSFAVVIIIIWTTSFLFGIIPTMISKKEVYEISQVCIGLPLVRENIYTQENVTYIADFSKNNAIQEVEHVHTIDKISGSTTGSWMQFSIAIFLGLNFLCCIIIFQSYLMIFIAVRKTATHVGRFKESHSEEIQMAIRMAVVVLTDFFCWMPIIILGILVQAGVITLSPTVYAWIITFVLPINSAVNPYLYSLITNGDVYKADKRPMRSRLQHARLSESGRDTMTQRELVSMLPMT